MKKLSLAVFLCVIVGSLSAQNCGLVDTVITTIADNGNGTSDYSFKVHKSTTSGGGKSVAITLYCGTDTFVNADCQPTATSPDSVSYGPFTITTCTNQIFLDWTGHTNTVCGGTSCRDSSGIPVPVTWLSTKLICKESQSLISWQTASEINNKGFEVQYLGPDGHWKSIGNVRGSSYSNSIENYQFEVSEYLKVATYFRIKQEDYDGTVSYSGQVRNNCNEHNEIWFYPNPAVSELTFSQEVFGYSIKDPFGRVLLSGGATGKIDLSTLKSGFYYLEYSNGFQTKTKPLVHL